MSTIELRDRTVLIATDVVRIGDQVHFKIDGEDRTLPLGKVHAIRGAEPISTTLPADAVIGVAPAAVPSTPPPPAAGMTRIRFRHDSIIAAEEARDRLAGKPPCRPEWVTDAEVQATPPSEPGDCWRIVYGEYQGLPESTAGYAICCPRCRELHYWTSANNCQKIDKTGTNADGTPFTYKVCRHQEARTSCWTWTVDADGSPLTARASLFVNHPQGCGYHGWLGGGGAPPGYLSPG